MNARRAMWNSDVAKAVIDGVSYSKRQLP